MSWLDDLLSSGTADKLIGLGLSAGAQHFGLNDPQIQKTGYLGEIPKYDLARERVPDTYDPLRRPGSSGQRYFTDTQFLPQGSQPAGLGAAGLAALNLSNPARQTRPVIPSTLAKGGIAKLKRGRYLDGPTSGMADDVPANIGGIQEARLSDGEFVVPADVVSHLGNGNSEAGADELYDMMDRIRKARTGTTKQAKEIDPREFLPA